jgi:hypothetical protein
VEQPLEHLVADSDGLPLRAVIRAASNERRLRELAGCNGSHGATFTDVDRQHLYRIKDQQADPDTLDEEVTAAYHSIAGT